MWRINHIIAHSHLRRSLFLRTKYQLCASDRRKHLLFNLFYRATDCLCGNLTEFFFVVIPLNLQHIIAVIISLQIKRDFVLFIVVKYISAFGVQPQFLLQRPRDSASLFGTGMDILRETYTSAICFCDIC